MGQTATKWWSPAITPVAAALLAFGTGTMAFAGVELVSSTGIPSAPPPAVSQLAEAVDPPVDGGPTEAGPSAAAEADRGDAVGEADEQQPVTTELDARPTLPALPGVAEVADDAQPAAGVASELVEDAVNALPSFSGARASGSGGPAHAGDSTPGASGPPDQSRGASDPGPSAPSGSSDRSDSSRPGQPQPSGQDSGGAPRGSGTSDVGDNAHPSGRDRSVEPGGSGTQGRAGADPDDDGRGPDRSNGGADQPSGPGGVDMEDQDGNNGCGNDDDFEDDNEGWCGRKPKPDSASAASPPAPTNEPGAKRGDRDSSQASRAQGASSPNPRRDSAPVDRPSDAEGSLVTEGDDPSTSTAHERTFNGVSDPERTRRFAVERPRPTSRSSDDESEGRVHAASADEPLVAKLTGPVQRVALAAAATVGASVLAFTGLEVWVLVLIAGSAIAIGGALLRVGRRREAAER